MLCLPLNYDIHSPVLLIDGSKTTDSNVDPKLLGMYELGKNTMPTTE